MPSVARVTEEPNPRTKLAAAIQRVSDTTSVCDRISGARIDIEAQARDARSALQQAHELLIKARHNEVATLLGECDASLPSVKQAETAFADAQSRIDTINRATEALDERERAAASSAALAKMHLKECLVAVVRTTPAIEALQREFDATRERLVAIVSALEVLAKVGVIERRQWLQFVGWPADDQSYSRQWREAVQALETDAFAALPGESE